MQLNSIKDVLKDISQGKMVIMVDDPSRENEGDLILSADHVSSEKINFMAKHARGLICVPMSEEYADRLDLELMTSGKPEDPYRTAWTVSVDAKKDVTTGISAHDRARTVRVLADPDSEAADLNRPGHVFPLRASAGGVLVRAGHTEASVDLMAEAGLSPVGVICEIMNEDGSMARLPELLKFAEKHSLKICSIEDLIAFRRSREKLIDKIAETVLPTVWGDFCLHAYSSKVDNFQHLALVKGDVTSGDPVTVRVHSQCLTGDVFRSHRCDCGQQLDNAMRLIQSESKGVLLYLSQEGRGIGIFNKLKAYQLQDSGSDTVEANEKLGFKPDLRDYGIGAQILADLGLKKIKLMTNNPRKIIGLKGYGLEVSEIIPVEVSPCESNVHYLSTKKKKLGHKLDRV